MEILEYQKEYPFFSWGFHIFDKWLQIKNSNKSLKRYFEDNLIYYVAIYGLGTIGKRLYEELHQEKIKVCYGIDQNAANIHIRGLKIKSLEEQLEEVDAVIVTPIAFYEIERNLLQKMGKEVDIIFIEDVIEYCFDLL